MVPRMRLERMTLWLKVKCSTNWANEALNKIYVAASARFELANATVKVWCLTAWLRGNFRWWKEMESNHRTRRNRFTVCRVWPLRYPSKQSGAGNRTWTHNLLITSQLLYQLSYSGKINGGRYRTRTYDPLLVRQVL